MELWLACALLTVVLYGLGEGLSKEPTVRLGPGRMLALYSLYSVPIYAGWFFIGNGGGSLSVTGVAFGAAVSGVTPAIVVVAIDTISWGQSPPFVECTAGRWRKKS